MLQRAVRDPNQALAYLVDCTLATVCKMAAQRSRSKNEFARQISIAQAGQDWLNEFKADCSGTRAAEVNAQFAGSVADWAAQFLVK